MERLRLQSHSSIYTQSTNKSINKLKCLICVFQGPAGSNFVGLVQGNDTKVFVYCAFSGNRGKFVEVFLGSGAVGTTNIWKK